MKIVKHLPNAVTLCNLLCGCLAIVFAMQGVFYASFVLILFGAFFDFCDGLVARALGAYSAIGKELDSLSDLVTFGVAPAVLGLEFVLFCDTTQEQIFNSPVQYYFQWLCFVPLIIAICTALRLAKFNLDDSQTESFKGLPSPACALIFASLVLYLKLYDKLFLDLRADVLQYSGYVTSKTILLEKYMVVLMSVILALLMVSRVKMFSFKFKSLGFRENRFRFILLVIIVLEIVAVVSARSIICAQCENTPYCALMLLSFTVFIALLTYILFNLAVNLFEGRDRAIK